MRASQLISLLADCIYSRGDIEVRVNYPDTDGRCREVDLISGVGVREIQETNFALGETKTILVVELYV